MHGQVFFFFFLVVFEVLRGTCGGGILILRQRSLSKQCLLRFLRLKIKIFCRVCCKYVSRIATKKFDHAEL